LLREVAIPAGAGAGNREGGAMSDKSASERLHNLCAALEQDLNESPFTREEWERLDAERLDLLKANDALRSRLADAEGRLVRIRGIAAEPRPINLTIRLANIVAIIDAPDGFSAAGAGGAT
jgi:hypothetical protein